MKFKAIQKRLLALLLSSAIIFTLPESALAAAGGSGLAEEISILETSEGETETETESESESESESETETETENPDQPEYRVPELNIKSFALAKDLTKKLTVPNMQVYVRGEVVKEIEPVTTWQVVEKYKDRVSIAEDGTITALAKGAATITADYSYYDVDETGAQILVGQGQGQVKLEVTDPVIYTTEQTFNMYGSPKNSKTKAYDTNYFFLVSGKSKLSKITASSTSKNMKFRISGDKVYLSPKKAGTYEININVDGRKITCKAIVYNIYFERNERTMADKSSKSWVPYRSQLILKKKQKTTLAVKGFPEGAELSWTSSNPKVASIKADGSLTAKNYGYTVITVEGGGFSLSYPVAVTYNRSYNVLQYAYKNWKSTYSQAKRMSKGYYDCSSFVWRSYMDAGFNIGKAKYWAPTAAGLAEWCVKNHYMMYEGTVEVSKLMPGDIIFWTGKNNGRYKGIYHTDLYIGNNTTLTVPSERVKGATISNCMVARIDNMTPGSFKAGKVLKEEATLTRLTWSGCVNADGYQVYRSTNKSKGFKKVKNVKGTAFTDLTAKSGKVYYYKVRPIYKSGKKTYYGRYTTVLSAKN